MSASFSVKPLRAIVSNPKWLESLHLWDQAARVNGGLTPRSSICLSHSDQTLDEHLIDTNRFEYVDGVITLREGGRELLNRMSELYRAICRENKEDRIVDEILDQLPRGSAVDVGCGPGYSSLRLARLGYAPVHSFDKSKTALEIAQAVFEGQGIEPLLHEEDATHLSGIESNSLALIYSRTALQYFDQAELAKAFSRTLRPGGHVVAEIVGLRYYLQLRHVLKLLKRENLTQPLSYWRTVLRTLMYEAIALQPRFAAAAPEIGFTRRSIRRLARWSGLEVLSISPAPSLVGYLVVMRKPS